MKQPIILEWQLIVWCWSALSTSNLTWSITRGDCHLHQDEWVMGATTVQNIRGRAHKDKLWVRLHETFGSPSTTFTPLILNNIFSGQNNRKNRKINRKNNLNLFGSWLSSISLN